MSMPSGSLAIRTSRADGENPLRSLNDTHPADSAQRRRLSRPLMSTTHNVLAAMLTLVIGAVIGQSIVSAHRTDAPRPISVRVDDLDLTHLPDTEVLLQRIADASVRACGEIPDFRHVRQAEAYERCRRAAITDAIRRVNQPIVTEIAETHAWPKRLAVR
jgi:UrcA family protein